VRERCRLAGEAFDIGSRKTVDPRRRCHRSCGQRLQGPRRLRGQLHRSEGAQDRAVREDDLPGVSRPDAGCFPGSVLWRHGGLEERLRRVHFCDSDASIAQTFRPASAFRAVRGRTHHRSTRSTDGLSTGRLHQSAAVGMERRACEELLNCNGAAKLVDIEDCSF